MFSEGAGVFVAVNKRSRLKNILDSWSKCTKTWTKEECKVIALPLTAITCEYLRIKQEICRLSGSSMISSICGISFYLFTVLIKRHSSGHLTYFPKELCAKRALKSKHVVFIVLEDVICFVGHYNIIYIYYCTSNAAHLHLHNKEFIISNYSLYTLWTCLLEPTVMGCNLKHVIMMERFQCGSSMSQ